MLLSEAGLARVTAVRRSVPLAAAILGLVAGATLVAAGPIGGQVLRVLAASIGTWLALRGWRAGSGRARGARGWIAAAMAIWLISETGRLVAALVGGEPHLAELSLIGLSIAAVGAYVHAVRGRMRPAEEAALYLDVAAIFFGVLGTGLVLGSSLVSDRTGFGILLHAAFFAALLASTLLINLSTRTRLRFVGPWELLAGVALAVVGYVGLLLPGTDATARSILHATVAAGVLLGGHGGAHWNADEDHRPRYEAIARSLRAMLPLTAVVVTGVVGVMAISRPELVPPPLRVSVGIILGLVVVSAIARQTLLLLDREKVLSRERQLTDELTVAEAQYRSVVERVPGVVYVAEAGQHGRWHFVSSKIEELLGYSAGEWMADPTLWMARMHPGDRDRMIVAETQDHERAEPIGRWEYRLIARDGRVVWVIDDEAVVARDADGHPTMVQGILVDISDRKHLEDQLRHQALHDPLTGLPNRVLFVDRLAHALLRRGNAGAGLAVLFLDLDDFKVINDTLGHAVGDGLLRLVGDRLTGVIRADDTACRLGGDEFAFLLEDATAEQAGEVAERIIDALGEPFPVGSRSVSLTASIGIAGHARVGDGVDSADVADELLRDADTAMYAAKSLGKGRVRVFDRRMEEPIARHRELRNALERAIGGDELFLEYQPMVDLRTGLAFGLEALVRWNHPQLGRLLPADFVSLAEESDLIGALGDWVLERACTDLAAGASVVSVNVSAHQLGGGSLAGRVAEILQRTGLPASRLLLELTESSLASAGAGAELEFEEIRALGVRVALDDFGSGYSSLEYLGRLPVDVLKIDRSLVERVHREAHRQEVMRAIVHIAERLRLDTIVEGVELEAQRATLLDLGFRQAQGFLFSPAVPLADALARTQVRRAS
jgi:diguanylate cyclase (GGDEF)-like protein/PAS domain S-box-containing protein